MAQSAVLPSPAEMAKDVVFVVDLPPETPLTDDLLERCVELNPYLDIERGAQGELILSGGSPGFAPFIGVMLVHQFMTWADETGGGLVGGAGAGVRRPHDLRTRAPNACWFTAEQAEEVLRQADEPGYPRVIPTVVVEIRRIGQSAASQLEKVREWMRDGAKVGWVIDPQSKTIYVFRDDGEPEVHANPPALEVGPEMPGLIINFKRIWGLLDR